MKPGLSEMVFRLGVVGAGGGCSFAGAVGFFGAGGLSELGGDLAGLEG